MPFQLFYWPILKGFVRYESPQNHRDTIHLKLKLGYVQSIVSFQLVLRYAYINGWVFADLLGSFPNDDCFFIFWYKGWGHSFFVWKFIFSIERVIKLKFLLRFFRYFVEKLHVFIIILISRLKFFSVRFIFILAFPVWIGVFGFGLELFDIFLFRIVVIVFQLLSIVLKAIPLCLIIITIIVVVIVIARHPFMRFLYV